MITGRRVRSAVLGVVAAALLFLTPVARVAADGNEAPGNPAAYRAVTSGLNHTCAILDSGAVKCWGYNANGQLGLGDMTTRGDGSGEMGNDLPAVDLGTGRTAVALSAGSNHTCAILDDGSVKCWGANGSGQLGVGDVGTRGDGAGEMGDDLPAVDLGTGRTAVAVTAGDSHTCAVLDDGGLKCWGMNANGRLGLGDTDPRGDGAGEMGDDLPAVDLGTGRTAVAVTAGDSHTCAVLDDGTVRCWGANGQGRLGLGDVLPRGDEAGEMGDSLPAVDLGTGRTAEAIAAGQAHTCALLDDGSVKCWGANPYGVLGQGDAQARGDVAGEMGDALTPVSLGTGRTATAVAAGDYHNCVRLDDASVKCWGNNDFGHLGLGDFQPRGDGAGEMGDALPTVALGSGRTVTAVIAGGFQNCARLDGDDLKCWGNNQSGQLGLGDTDYRGNEPGEMGDALPAVDLGGLAALTVTKDADQSAVLVGEPITYHLTVTNTGEVGLTDVSITDPDAPACDRVLGDLAAGAPAATVDCGYTPTAADVGTYTNQASADSDQTDPVSSNPVDVLVDQVRPDARIRRGTGPLVGNNIYNGTGTNQTRSGSVGPGGSVTFTVNAQNDGSRDDDFVVSGPRSTPRFRLVYRSGGRDVTTRVVAGTFTYEGLPAGAARSLTLTITAKPGATRGSRITAKIRVRSDVDPTRTDVVAAVVSRT